MLTQVLPVLPAAPPVDAPPGLAWLDQWSFVWVPLSPPDMDALALRVMVQAMSVAHWSLGGER